MVPVHGTRLNSRLGGNSLRLEGDVVGTMQFGSEEPVQSLPSSLRTFIALERFHMHKLDLYQQPSVMDPSFDTRFFPQNCGAFRLPAYWVGRKHFYVYGAQRNEESELRFFSGNSDNGDRVLLPIHPLELSHFQTFLSSVAPKAEAHTGIPIWAVPTSSTRTLLVWAENAPERALFAKLPLRSRIFGDRRMYKHRVAGSVGRNKLLQCLSLPPDFICLAEAVGFVPRKLQDSGVVVRSLPAKAKNGSLVLAPLFSLFGGDRRDPLLLQVLHRTGTTARQWVDELLCLRFAELWLTLSMQFGLLLEAHGQNMMIALSPDLKPLDQFVFRDFDGIFVDWELRRAQGLHEPIDLPNASAWHETYATNGALRAQLISHKVHTSLYCYTRLVLCHLNEQLCEWQRTGLVNDPPINEGELAQSFLNYLVHAVSRQFGLHLEAPFRIGQGREAYRSLYPIVVLLLRARATLVGNQCRTRYLRAGTTF
jgi:hypothetical protein